MSDTITRRALVKGAMGSAALAGAVLAPNASTAVAKPRRQRPQRHTAPDESRRGGPYAPDQFPADDELFGAPGLPGGGQLEVRMYAEPTSSDPDVRDIAQRLYPFNLGSYYALYVQAAQKNEALAAQYEGRGDRAMANKYYLRAATFYSAPLSYLSEHDSRMLPTYRKLEEAFNKAWQLVSPPFERVRVPYQGQLLDGLYFAAPKAAAGQRAPVVLNYGGADAILLSGNSNQGAPYTSRGISFINVDGPGQGGSLRLKNLYAPPDSERYAKAVVDYLVSRPDVDPDRIGIIGSSMGGYTAPRSCTGEKRFRACATWSSSFALQRDIFDYYPPIQDKLRWLIGARSLKDARAMMAEFTLRYRVREIEAALLIGYSTDDRIMNPGGARELRDKAVNARSREVVLGTGHYVGGPPPPVDRTTYIADWFAKQFGTA